jgi:hypothetical protein
MVGCCFTTDRSIDRGIWSVAASQLIDRSIMSIHSLPIAPAALIDSFAHNREQGFFFLGLRWWRGVPNEIRVLGFALCGCASENAPRKEEAVLQGRVDEGFLRVLGRLHA